MGDTGDPCRIPSKVNTSPNFHVISSVSAEEHLGICGKRHPYR